MWQCKNSVALILACAMAPLSWSGTAEIFSRAESLVYSENLPIDSWLNDMQGATAEPGNEAITHNQLEIGAAYGGFELSAFYQRDYYFYFTNDTFDLVYRDKNDLPFENREKYDINLNVQHVYLQGVRAAYTYTPFEQLQLKATLGYFYADDLLFGEISGYLANPTGKVGGDLVLDYQYTEDVVADRALTAPGEGKGESLDLALRWQPSDQWRYSLRLTNAYGVVHWKNAPFSRLTISTVRTFTDKNGNKRRAPMISGTEYFRDIDQVLPKQVHSQLVYRGLKPWGLEAQYSRYDETDFRRVMVNYYWRDTWYAGLGYDWDANAPRLSLQSPYAFLVLSADTTDEKKAKYLNLNVGLRWAF